MGNSHESDKAARYIAQLDEARCTGRWQDVPELSRKVEKHAPHRQCLAQTARSEAQISIFSTQRPATGASTSSSSLSMIIPALLTAIENEGEYVQDAFQATVCLGWLHYVLEEPGLAVARLPKDFSAVVSKMASQGSSLSGWSRVCIVKGAFLKGSSQDRTGATDDAVQTYLSIIPWLSSQNSINSESSLFKAWTERLIVRLCQLIDQSTESGESVEPEDALRAYRFWAKYWESTGKIGTEGMARHRRSAWKAYYDTLSTILREDLPYATEDMPSTTEKPQMFNSKLQQRAELKRVEIIYETLLFKETQFPKASESNHETEAWTDAVMENWRILCGPTWTDADLGEGGKEAVGRGVLDILYRAATKTFHSTPILRHLFTVHASLAEFELAFKAYDSYVEIITRGKDRAEKTGEDEGGLDSNTMILRTSAEAIRLLCRFGSRKEAAKALEIGENIQRWLEQTQHLKSTGSEAGLAHSIETAIHPRALAVTYSALGISHAHWARYTYDADARTSIQSKAVQYLQKSLEPRFEDPNNVEALYALALVLAEMREIPRAIKVAKRALSPSTKGKNAISVDGVISGGLSTEYGRERKLIPVWHLLALLLTTRSEYTAAEKSCENAFAQFGTDPTILFGNDDDAYRSEHLNQANGNAGKSLGIVDQMETFEKSSILQVKMTQLTLVETIEGATAAVDGCDELLALYARLFGDPAVEAAKLQPPTTETAVPLPKSAVGTIRGSIFRGKGSVKGTTKDTTARSSVVSSRPSTVATVNPTIQVTDENGSAPSKQRHSHMFHHNHDEAERPDVQRSPSNKLKKRSANSLRRRSEMQEKEAPEVPELPDVTMHGTSVRNSTASTLRYSTTPTLRNSMTPSHTKSASVSSSIRKSVEGGRPLSAVAHNMPHSKEPPPTGHSHQPPKQDARLPAPLPGESYIPPDPRFSLIQSRRQKVSLLVDIWIFISGLYIRAAMFEDAKGAVSEALKLAQTFEGEVAQESSSSRAFSDRGWGGGRSVEQLWADAFAAKGELMLAQSLKHEARVDFERAVLHYPDHPEAIVGLSNILLDIYCKVISLEPNPGSDLHTPSSPPTVPSEHETADVKNQHLASHTPSAENKISAPELNRLAARDRAFGLLSTLTKLGAGWDYSEAWYALARAYEESGQLQKTKEVLWWCVELEDTHPIRNWNNVALGGFVL